MHPLRASQPGRLRAVMRACSWSTSQLPRPSAAPMRTAASWPARSSSSGAALPADQRPREGPGVRADHRQVEAAVRAGTGDRSMRDPIKEAVDAAIVARAAVEKAPAEEDSLAMCRRHVERADQIAARQQEIIERLRQLGADQLAAEAIEVLTLMQHLRDDAHAHLAQELAKRDR